MDSGREPGAAPRNHHVAGIVQWNYLADHTRWNQRGGGVGSVAEITRDRYSPGSRREAGTDGGDALRTADANGDARCRDRSDGIPGPDKVAFHISLPDTSR